MRMARSVEPALFRALSHSLRLLFFYSLVRVERSGARSRAAGESAREKERKREKRAREEAKPCALALGSFEFFFFV